MKKIIIFLLISHVITVSFSQSRQTSLIRNLSVEKFQRSLDSLNDEIIIDLRTPDEIKNGIIPNARHIDFFGSEFEPALTALDKNKVYFIYCASGARSGETVEVMRKMGFKTIYNLEEGFRVWIRKKMPVADN